MVLLRTHKRRSRLTKTQAFKRDKKWEAAECFLTKYPQTIIRFLKNWRKLCSHSFGVNFSFGVTTALYKEHPRLSYHKRNRKKKEGTATETFRALVLERVPFVPNHLVSKRIIPFSHALKTLRFKQYMRLRLYPSFGSAEAEMPASLGVHVFKIWLSFIFHLFYSLRGGWYKKC